MLARTSAFPAVDDAGHTLMKQVIQRGAPVRQRGRGLGGRRSARTPIEAIGSFILPLVQQPHLLSPALSAQGRAAGSCQVAQVRRGLPM